MNKERFRRSFDPIRPGIKSFRMPLITDRFGQILITLILLCLTIKSGAEARTNKNGKLSS